MRNKYEIRGDVTAVFIVKDNITHECLIDTEDLEKLLIFGISWHLKKSSTRCYVNNSQKKPRAIHRLLFGELEEGHQIDHINGDTLDNRKSNLRSVLPHENQQNKVKSYRNNTSGVRGVGLNKKTGKYYATVTIKGKRHNLGYFDKIEDAEKAVKYARSQLMPFSADANQQLENFVSPYKRNTFKKSGVKYITWHSPSNKWWIKDPKSGKGLGMRKELEDAIQLMNDFLASSKED
jgi:hypothetical protein